MMLTEASGVSEEVSDRRQVRQTAVLLCSGTVWTVYTTGQSLVEDAEVTTCRHLTPPSVLGVDRVSWAEK